MAHKIRLYPTSAQEQGLRRAVGCARFAWNWCLAEFQKELALWREAKTRGDKPTPISSTMALKKRFNAIKEAEFPWVYNSPKDANQQPFTYFDKARKRWVKKTGGFPKPKKKGQRDSFYLSNDKFSLSGKMARIPKIGNVRMVETLRFSGKILGATVRRVADRWFLSVQVEVADSVHKLQQTGNEIVGVDLGVKNLATLSTGEVIEGPKAHKKALKQLRRQGKAVSRKVKGSNNRRKAAQRLAKTHARIADIRNDALHKLTTRLCRENQAVGIEDLNVSGMVRNRKLARAISDMGFYEFKRQLLYKAERYGTRIVLADRWFASTQICSACGARREKEAKLTLAECTYRCTSCGFTADRDVNAALNLKRTAGNAGSQACGPDVSPVFGQAIGVEAGSPGGPHA